MNGEAGMKSQREHPPDLLPSPHPPFRPPKSRSDAWERAASWLLARPARVTAALLVLGLVLFLTGLGQRTLWTPDEGRYAEVPHEMLAAGDWLTPRLNGVKYFEKPPLHYWLVGAAFEALGETEFAARLPNALCATLALLPVAWFGAVCFGLEVGALAALILAVSPLYFALARMDIIDTPLMLFYTLGLAGWGLAISNFGSRISGSEKRDVEIGGDQGDIPFGSSSPHPSLSSHPPFRSPKSPAALVGWAALALATLVKGPVALALAVATVALWMLLTRRWDRWRALMPLPGIVLYLAITAPWFIAVSRKNPEFAWFFFIHEHVLRFLTTEHHHEGPVWYYGPVLLLGFFPWSAWLPAAALWAGSRFKVQSSKFKVQSSRWAKGQSPNLEPGTLNLEREQSEPLVWLALWAAVPFVFFSLSGSKLITYVLPAFPALALLVAAWWPRSRSEKEKAGPLWRGAVGLAAGAGILAIALPLVPKLAAKDTTPGVTPWVIGCAAAVAAAAVIVPLAARRSEPLRVLAVLAVVAIAFGFSLDRACLALDQVRGMRRIAEPVRARPEARLVYVNSYDQAFNFYSRHRGVVVGLVGELEFGRDHAPDRATYFQEEAVLPSLLSERAPTFYLVRGADWQRLAPLFAGRARVVMEARKHVLLFASGGSDGAAAR